MRLGTSSPARFVLAAGLASALAPLAATASSAAVRQAGPIKVTGTGSNTFTPKDIKAAPDANGKITIEFKSEGFHTIQSDEVPGFDSDVVQNSTKTITFDAPAPGQYKVYCELHKPGMAGTLTVSGEAVATTAPATEEPTEEPTVSAPPASGSASATAGTGEDDAPVASEHDPKDPFKHVHGVEGNAILDDIEGERAAQAGAVSGFKFFTFVSIAFLFILGAAVLFSTRSRRSAR